MIFVDIWEEIVFLKGLVKLRELRNIEHLIGHVLNEQRSGYEYLKSIKLKNGARHLKEHPNGIGYLPS